MPLVAATLKTALESCFASPPPGASGCAQAWADAMGSYAGAVVPPSTTISAAKSTLQAALTAAFSAPNAAPAMESAFTSFAATVGLGMAGAGFAATPPPGPVGLAVLFSGPKPPTHSAAALQISSAIDTWMRTGIATLIAPPNTPQPWA